MPATDGAYFRKGFISRWQNFKVVTLNSFLNTETEKCIYTSITRYDTLFCSHEVGLFYVKDNYHFINYKNVHILGNVSFEGKAFLERYI